MLKVAVVGASGYSGAELVRLLANHPEVKVVAATSETFAGKKLREVYPGLGSAGDILLTTLAQTELTPRKVEAVFLALPHGEAQTVAPGLLATGLKVIDLSGDFRFADTAIYEKWYQRKHTAKDWAGKAVYGFPELFRSRLAGAQLVANPGCYVTGAVLALFPLLKAGWAAPDSLIVDAKSGWTGAGRKAQTENMFTQAAENVSPYKMAGIHQHIPEMEQALAQATGQAVRLTFSPQMVPARRGILTTAYARLLQPRTSETLAALVQETYREEPFLTVLGSGASWPELVAAVGSNQCVVKAAVDANTGLAVVVSAIDNLIKGAAGMAIQNLNLMFGLPETSGLPGAGFAL
jgi:N-acetyl-gamma-glutamyl-phosphate reductase